MSEAAQSAEVVLAELAPIPMIAEATVSVQARLTVITAVMPSRLERVLPELCAQNVHWNLAIGGAGASQELADRCDALHLPNDPISAADFAFG